MRGGSAVWKESNNAKKAYAREVYSLYKQPVKKFRVDQTISFFDEDYVGIITPHEDALVITTSIADYTVNKILVDNGSSLDILYHHALNRVNLQGIHMEPCKEALLYKFGNKPVNIAGTITLSVVVGLDVKLYVVKVPSAYNMIFGRTTLTALKAVTSIPYLKMKFPTENGIWIVSGCQKTS